MKITLAAVCLSLAWVTAANANDTTAELATGGLHFVTSEDLEMQSEDLFISTERIEVRYRFANTSKQDVTTLVAFPMPDITIQGLDDDIAVPTDNPENILDFKTVVDGKPVATKVEQKVFAYGIDRTEYLRKLGIPLPPQLQATRDALTALPRDKWAELEKLGLAVIDESGDGKEIKKYLNPTWTLKTTYYWEQTFPAGKTLNIEHAYKPSVGGSAVTNLGEGYALKEAYYKEYVQKYCIEPSLETTYQRLKKAGGESGGWGEQRIAYILKTGANWAGPIKSFRLVVDKGDPASLVSFCGEGVKKISATRFEMRKSDFTPEDDLDVVILVKPGKG